MTYCPELAASGARAGERSAAVAAAPDTCSAKTATTIAAIERTRDPPSPRDGTVSASQEWSRRGPGLYSAFHWVWLAGFSSRLAPQESVRYNAWRRRQQADGSSSKRRGVGGTASQPARVEYRRRRLVAACFS